MLKIVFIIILLLYAGVIGTWSYRFIISYRLTNGSNHDLVVDHDFTAAEREGVKKAYRIRQKISNILLYSSVLLSVGSFVILRNNWIEPRVIIKVVMYISGLIAAVLILVNGIRFVPGPPIR
ncbi:MAG TPA: hypothetical protein VK616_03975 [Flavitalea sp.]|nr:hypothetical protein [Flavitalea sp.]HTF27669.1 hypothetical protein [Flavitalea sp.]